MRELTTFQKEVRDRFYGAVKDVPSDLGRVSEEFDPRPVTQLYLRLTPLKDDRSPLEVWVDEEGEWTVSVRSNARFIHFVLGGQVDYVDQLVSTVVYGGIREKRWVRKGRIVRTEVCVQLGAERKEYCSVSGIRLLDAVAVRLFGGAEESEFTYRPYLE